MKRNLLSYFLLLFAFASCQSSKMVVEQEISYKISADLVVEEAFLQEEISGQKDEKMRQYLTIRMKEEELSKEIKIDSIGLGTKYYLFSSNSQIKNNLIRLEMKEGVKKIAQEEAIIFYSRQKQAFKQIVPLLVKPPVYLP